MLPPNDEAPRKKILYIMGGIIFNISMGLLSIFLLTMNFSITVKSCLYFFGIASIFIGIGNFLPSMSKKSQTDGSRLFNLYLSRPKKEQLQTLKDITNQLQKGLRPRSIQFYDSINLNQYDQVNIIIVSYLYYQAIDSDDNEKALKYLNYLKKHIKLINENIQTVIYCELCYMSSIHNEIENSKKYYELIKDKLTESIDDLRIKAYYHYYVNKDIDLTYKICQMALEKEITPPIGLGLMSKDLINKSLNSIEN